MAVTKWSTPDTLGPANTTLGSFGAFSAGPSVISLPTGGYAVAWTQGAAGATTIAYEFFNPLSYGFTGIQTIAAEVGSVYMPQITNSGGNVAITYTRNFNNGGDEDVRWRLFDPDGISQGAAVNIAVSTAIERDTAVTAISQGIAVAYESGQDIILERRGFAGQLLGGVLTVASGANAQETPSVTSLTGGNIVVA